MRNKYVPYKVTCSSGVFAQLLANQQTSHTYLFKQVDRKMKVIIKALR